MDRTNSQTIPAIEVKDMVKKFGSFTANNCLNFHVNKGEIFGFLGANGAGKTTAMKIIIGISSPTSGEIFINGESVVKNAEKIKHKIGYMSQKFSLYDDLTVNENIRLFAGIYGIKSKIWKQKRAELIQSLHLENVQNSLVKSIPLGWKQKLAFSMALFHNPQIVFLDEPTGGVDPLTRREFWNMIYKESEKGVTFFVTTHYMDEAEYCDRVAILSEGNLIALNTPENLKKENQCNSMEEVFIQLARNVE